MRKTISVAIATYNGGKYLRKQLESLYNQDIIPDEIVVSDDGSTDETLSILEEYHVKHGLKYSLNNGTHGFNHNFYRAISLCTSDIIAICDQDDIWLPCKISKSFGKLKEIDNGKPACVSSLCYNIDKDDNLISSLSDEHDTYGYAATMLTYGKGQNRSQGCSLMFNRKLSDIVLTKIRTYPEIKDLIFYDAFIAYTAALVGNKYNLGQRLMLYRHHSSNVLAKAGLKKESILNRIRNNEYFLFIPQARLRVFSLLLKWFTEEETNRKAYCLCKKISKISTGSHYAGLHIIMKLDELSLLRKIQILMGTIAMDLFKIFLK